jgi:hypothetical protein
MIGALFTWIAGSRTSLVFAKWAAIGLTISLFLLSLRRSCERAGQLAGRLDSQEKVYEIQHKMLGAASRRPRDRDDLAQRLRDGKF